MFDVSNSTIKIVHATVAVFMDDENQDSGMTLEMSQHMLNDLINHGRLADLITYVQHYSTTIDNAADANVIVHQIEDRI